MRNIWRTLPLATVLVASSALAEDTADAAADEDPAATEETSDDETADDAPAGDDAPADDVPAGPSAEDVAYAKEMLGAQQGVHLLKERAYQAKSLLQALRAMTIEGGSFGSRVLVVQEYKLGRGYKVTSIEYWLDGRAINLLEDLDPAVKTHQIHEAPLTPGRHRLKVQVKLQGNAEAMPYLDDYNFSVGSQYEFEVGEGRRTTLNVIVDDKGNLVPYEERPYVHYDVSEDHLRKDEVPQ